ncbi:alpha-amylase family glycosyl hydrolase [Paracoccus albus]|uniref:alpha-amylase family glycosyl hydrolase n=1 Tax=Paracoccus albus TaxID=3017784 RepID=UPI003EBF63D6
MMSKTEDWWKGAVIYQIYPRSYQDTTGDGGGDLKGIANRMDYIASLGVDAIWISPFFTSPMKDFGYDVSDYRGIDPIFGRMEDFEEIVARAHQFGIKVMIDLVLSHTSDQHPWFQESKTSRDNPKADWYVWADPKLDGTPPTNWLSIFGGSAWQWNPAREQYYLHNFLREQPDLNFHNPDVQGALLDVVQFWMGKGVDGFRLDTINFYFHDAQLRDNPGLQPEDRRSDTAPSVNPYNHQSHQFDKSQPENLDFLKKLRQVLDHNGCAAVGEIGDSEKAWELLDEYTKGDERVHMSYVFDFLSGDDLTAERIAQVFEEKARRAPDGWPCWAFSNHDVVRHVSRWNLGDTAAKAYCTVLMCLQGSICIYQGEELGLPEADIAFEDLQDPYGIEFWPEFKGRDGARTPMVWDANSNDHYGFSQARPWLPVPPEHRHLAVSEQDHQAGSMLNHYRWAIELRHKHPALRKGNQTGTRADGSILSFRRSTDRGSLTVRANLSDSRAAGMEPWQVDINEE